MALIKAKIFLYDPVSHHAKHVINKLKNAVLLGEYDNLNMKLGRRRGLLFEVNYVSLRQLRRDLHLDLSSGEFKIPNNDNTARKWFKKLT